MAALSNIVSLVWLKPKDQSWIEPTRQDRAFLLDLQCYSSRPKLLIFRRLGRNYFSQLCLKNFAGPLNWAHHMYYYRSHFQAVRGPEHKCVFLAFSSRHLKPVAAAAVIGKQSCREKLQALPDSTFGNFLASQNRKVDVSKLHKIHHRNSIFRLWNRGKFILCILNAKKAFCINTKFTNW